MHRFRLATFLLALAPLAAVAGGDGKKDPLPGVKAVLTISVKEYDPAAPSKGVVKCVVVNKSEKAIAVPVNHGRGATLIGQGEGQGWELRLWRRDGDKAGKKWGEVEPGAEQVIFELPLDDILFNGVKEPPGGKDRVWGWDWIARPAPPRSPVHAIRGAGFLPKASFWAEVTVGGKTLLSEKVELKVKANKPK